MNEMIGSYLFRQPQQLSYISDLFKYKPCIVLSSEGLI